MSKLDKERQGKVNTIVYEITEMMDEFEIKYKLDFLGHLSNIICRLDTDIAIEVMEQLGVEGKHQAHTIKVNYGY